MWGWHPLGVGPSCQPLPFLIYSRRGDPSVGIYRCHLSMSLATLLICGVGTDWGLLIVRHFIYWVVVHSQALSSTCTMMTSSNLQQFCKVGGLTLF